MWVTALLSVFQGIGNQEAAAQRAQAAAVADARKEQQKVYAMAAGLVGLGFLAVVLKRGT